MVVYEASEGEIAADDFRGQIKWLQADLDGGATLVVPKDFDPNENNLRLVTASLVYTLKPFLDEGARTWDIAVCSTVKPRSESFRLGEDGTHVLLQPVALARHAREAKELRGRLGPDALDWSVFATPRLDVGVAQESDTIRRALILVQTVDAVVKALESYPVQILDTNRRDGRRYVILRAQPNNDRDRVARKIGLPEGVVA